MNEALFWFDVDLEDVAAPVFERHLIFKPLFERVSVSSVMAVIEVCTRTL